MGKAGSVDALWELIGEACRDFGFQRVRMQLGTEVREQWIEPIEQHLTSVWQLRIELPEGQYVNLYRDASRPMHPMVMTTFGQILERTLRVKAVLAVGASPAPILVQGN